MKILTPDHKYELENFENKEAPGQVIQFIQKEQITKEPGSDAVVDKLVTVFDGTTNEEVIKMLMDRLNGLQAKFPCRENAIATTHLETALLWLEKRTAERTARGVEGKHLK